jgi:hypothetical protein
MVTDLGFQIQDSGFRSLRFRILGLGVERHTLASAATSVSAATDTFYAQD